MYKKLKEGLNYVVKRPKRSVEAYEVHCVEMGCAVGGFSVLCKESD